MDFNALTDEEKKFLIQSLPPNKIGNDIYEKLIGKASTTIDFSVLSSEVKMLQAAQEKFDTAWNNFYKHTVPLLDLARFWQIVDSLKNRLINCDFNAEAAIQEMFRLSQVPSSTRKEFSFCDKINGDFLTFVIKS